MGPTGKTILVDGGDRGKHRPILEQLAADGIETLDLVVLSHPHADHLGGMQKVLESVPTRLFLDPGFDHPSRLYEALLEHLETTQTPVAVARRGRRIDIGGDAAIEILWPEPILMRGTRSDANSNSIVFRLVYGQTAMLFTGDAEEPTENRLLEEQAEALRADVLKVAHHGSGHSSTPGFLEAVSPTISVVSCGVDNRFDHPSPATIDRLGWRGRQIFRTDLHGTISLVSNGVTWSPETARGPPPVAGEASTDEASDTTAAQTDQPSPHAPRRRLATAPTSLRISTRPRNRARSSRAAGPRR